MTVLSPGGKLAAGVIVPSIYSDAYPAPSNNPTLHVTHYPDGSVVQYDHAVYDRWSAGRCSDGDSDPRDDRCAEYDLY